MPLAVASARPGAGNIGGLNPSGISACWRAALLANFARADEDGAEAATIVR